MSMFKGSSGVWWAVITAGVLRHIIATDNVVVIVGMCWLLNIITDFGWYTHLPFREREFSFEAVGKIVSVAHTFLTVPIATAYLLNMATLETWLLTQQITMGYLIYDGMYLLLFARMFNKPDDTAMLVHHLSFYLGINLLPVDYQRLVAMAYLAEISNPFLYLSWYLYKSGYHVSRPRLFKYVAVLLILSFFVFRICNFSNLVFAVAKASYMGAILGSALWTLNVVWFYKLVKKFKEASETPAIVKKTE